jgi:hypothetical protein
MYQNVSKIIQMEILKPVRDDFTSPETRAKDDYDK